MIKIFPSGLLDTNTYAVWDETTRVGMVIDCGVKPALVKDYVKDMGITVKYVVLTHGHFDHIAGVKRLKEINLYILVLFLLFYCSLSLWKFQC